MSPILGHTHDTNEWATSFRDAAPDRVLAFGGFDPRVADGPDAEIETALEELPLSDTTLDRLLRTNARSLFGL